jgi:phage FluMu protein Com
MKGRAVLKCNFCDKVFKKMIDPMTYEIKCPKCREIDVEVIGIEKD